jgi:hypothetical protein
MTISEIDNSNPQPYHDIINRKLTSIWKKIQSLKGDYEAQRDLKSLHMNLRAIWNKMDNEMIECRRRGRVTSTYIELAISIETYLKVMDREVFWQQLH